MAPIERRASIARVIDFAQALDEGVLLWLHERPGAEQGDAEGIAVKRPYRKLA